MRIAVRFSPPTAGTAGSQKTIARHLIPELKRLHDDLVLFTATPECFPAVPGLVTVPTREFGKARTLAAAVAERLADQFTFERDLRRHGCDVVYYPYTHEAPFLTLGVPQVITVHDLIPVVFPEHFPLMSKQWRLFTLPSLRLARSVIVPSERTRSDLIRIGRVRPAKIRVVPNGFGGGEPGAARPSANERGRYILYVSSSLYPHKNVEGLCEGLALIRELIPHKVIVVGRSVPRFSAGLRERIARLGLQERVLLLEDVSADDLASLYMHAELFAYPSRYEGFGIPPLEAMQYGVPVVASNATTIPEVCGDAARYFDPDSPREIAEALLAGLRDEQLRAVLSARGIERTKAFQWSRTASGVLEVCHAALQGRRAP